MRFHYLNILFLFLTLSGLYGQRNVREYMLASDSSVSPNFTYTFSVPENEDYDYLVAITPVSITGMKDSLDSDKFHWENGKLLTRWSFNREHWNAKNTMYVALTTASGVDVIATINVTDVTGKYDQNGYADADLAAKYPEVNVGDYLIFNDANAQGNIFAKGGEFDQMQPGNKIRIRGDVWGNLTFYLSQAGSGNAMTDAGFVTITNWMGQVDCKFFATKGDRSYIRITGKYEPAKNTGHRFYVGHDSGYVHTHRKYGFAIHCGAPKDLYSCGHAVVADGGSFDHYEFDYLELWGGGFSGFNVKNNNQWGLDTSVYIHDCYIHDMDSEGIYQGSTAGNAQTYYADVKIYNNRILRCGGEPLQTGRTMSLNVYNNTTSGGLDWPSPFQNNQYGKHQGSPTGGGGLWTKNVSIHSAGSDAFFPRARDSQMVLEGLIFHDDTLEFSYNLNNGTRNSLEVFIGIDKSKPNSVSFWYHNNWLGNKMHRGFEEQDLTPNTGFLRYAIGTSGGWEDSTLGANGNPIYVDFTDNMVDTTYKDGLDREGVVTKLTGNTRPNSIPALQVTNYMGISTAGDVLDKQEVWMGMTRYVDKMCEDSQTPRGGTTPGPQVWDGCGNPKVHEVGSVVQYWNDEGDIRFYICLQFNNTVGGNPSTDDSNPDNQYWRQLKWLTPGGKISYYPPDDVRLTPSSYYDQFKLGVRDILPIGPIPPSQPVPNQPPPR